MKTIPMEAEPHRPQLRTGPKRVLHPKPGLVVRGDWLPNGWRLVLSGEAAKGMRIESVMQEVERLYRKG